MGTERETSSVSERLQSRSAVGPVGATGDVAPEPAFVMPFATGELIAGKYKVIELIGTGGVGFVVSARHVRLDELVAIKFLRPEFADHAEAVRRFTVEARANFKIKNDHVVRVLDVDALENGAPFIVMELLEGTDLGRVISARGALPIALALEYVLQACEAIAAAHACYVVHRDIKPENLFITREGLEVENVKVLDFGISKLALGPALSHEPAATLSVLGSPPYMSPEQLRAAEEVDARTDIWSLGCVLYELLTGVAPFERSSVPEICSAVLADEAPPLRLMRPSIAPALDAVVLRCLQKHPEQRYRDVAELAAALAAFAPPAARVYAERCRKLLEPVPAEPPVMNTHMDFPPEPAVPAQKESAQTPARRAAELPELAQIKRAGRRSGARFAAWGLAVLAVMYVIVQALGTPRAAERVHTAQPKPVQASVAALPFAAPVPAASSLEIPAPAPAPIAREDADARKPALKSRALWRTPRRASNEPDVGF